MVDDVSLNKAAIIERCVARVRQEYAGEDANLKDNQTRQDAIILNLQRACEAAIGLAMHTMCACPASVCLKRAVTPSICSQKQGSSIRFLQRKWSRWWGSETQPSTTTAL